MNSHGFYLLGTKYLFKQISPKIWAIFFLKCAYVCENNYKKNIMAK